MSPAFTSPRLWAALGALVSGTSVVLGACGWHSLSADETMRGIFMLAAQHQMAHGLALFAVAWLCDAGGRAAMAAAAAGTAFVAGVVLFSVNLYVLTVTGAPLLVGAAPVGGFAMMAGWAALAL
ncbi:MAG: DUF423 domain-containing protein, partial [Rhodospirillaceae bacterium]